MQRDDTPRTNAMARNANAFTSANALARRNAYDASWDALTPTQLVARMQQERATFAQRTRDERLARQRVDVPTRSVARGSTPNLWEVDAPRDVHRPSDRACHHPLVNCHHKW